MNFDERAANARTELGTMLDGVDTPPASRIRTLSRRRRVLQVSAGALAVAVVALGVVVVVEFDDHKEPVILTPPSTDTTTTVPVGVSAHLELSTTTVEAGGTIKGTLVIDNNTAEPFAFGDRCAPSWTVTLQNDSVANEPVFPLPCLPVEQLPIGRTTYAFTVATTYSSCAGEGALPSTQCLPDGGLPPLPAGQYDAVFAAAGEAGIAPAPVPVTVTAATATTTTTTSTTTTDLARGFPAAATPTQGGTTWAVVLAGGFVPPGTPLDSDETLNMGVAAAARGGYTTGPTDSDQGADVAWGTSPDAVDFYSVSVYFGSEADALRANAAFERIGWTHGVVAQVETFCLD